MIEIKCGTNVARYYKDYNEAKGWVGAQFMYLKTKRPLKGSHKWDACEVKRNGIHHRWRELREKPLPWHNNSTNKQ
jgi:hypothetical protein